MAMCSSLSLRHIGVSLVPQFAQRLGKGGAGEDGCCPRLPVGARAGRGSSCAHGSLAPTLLRRCSAGGGRSTAGSRGAVRASWGDDACNAADVLVPASSDAEVPSNRHAASTCSAEPCALQGRGGVMLSAAWLSVYYTVQHRQFHSILFWAVLTADSELLPGKHR